MTATNMKVYMAERRKSRRAKLVDMAGGKCVECGSDDNLEFDHINPEQKTFNLSGCYLDKAWSKIIEEFEKCQLLCKDCHYQKSVNSDWSKVVDHGGGLTGKRGCYCELCGPLKNAYNKKYK